MDKMFMIAVISGNVLFFIFLFNMIMRIANYRLVINNFDKNGTFERSASFVVNKYDNSITLSSKPEKGGISFINKKMGGEDN